MSKVQYNTNTNISSDTCWKNSKDTNNKDISDYTLYDKYFNSFFNFFDFFSLCFNR